jgi:hypothetical protein
MEKGRFIMVNGKSLIPFRGTESFVFYQNIESAREILDLAKVGYTEELWESSSETVSNP